MRDEGGRVAPRQGGPAGLCSVRARSGWALPRTGTSQPKGSPRCACVRPFERSEALATAQGAGAARADRRGLFGAMVRRVAPQGSRRGLGPGSAGGLTRGDLAVAHGVEEVRIDRSRGGTGRKKERKSLSPKNGGSATPTGFESGRDPDLDPGLPGLVSLRSPLLGASPQPRIPHTHDSRLRIDEPIPVTAFRRQPRGLAQETSTSEI